MLRWLLQGSNNNSPVCRDWALAKDHYFLPVAFWHLTPTSSLCTQLCWPSVLAGQSVSLLSVPRHWTLSSQIWPLPLVKPVVRATAPAKCHHDSTRHLSGALLTSDSKSQLCTNHSSISSTPEVITHRAPGIVVADLHTSLVNSTSTL